MYCPWDFELSLIALSYSADSFELGNQGPNALGLQTRSEGTDHMMIRLSL